MVLGYDMFRNLTNTQAKRIRKNALETFQSTLVDPGEIVFVYDRCRFQITPLYALLTLKRILHVCVCACVRACKRVQK
jgi:hypothetical protein